jgi:hypothetical protein
MFISFLKTIFPPTLMPAFRNRLLQAIALLSRRPSSTQPTSTLPAHI